MIELKSLVSSNLVQIVVTFAIGVLVFAMFSVCKVWRSQSRFAAEHASRCDAIAGLLIASFAYFYFLIIAVCFVFDLGETYIYSTWYKRSFGPFGDGFPFALIVCLAYAYKNRQRSLFAICMTALLLSGGRALLVMSIITIFAQAKFSRRNDVWAYIWKSLIVAVSSYFTLVAISNHLSPATKEGALVAVRELGITSLIPIKPALHVNACKSTETCVVTQLAQPARQRLVTSLAGLWMTFNGNFVGKNYPGTREKFADLMMARNPWGINDRFKMDRIDWLRAGRVQNPYLNFSSGYGPLGLFMVLVFFVTTAIMGLVQLRSQRDSSVHSVWMVFLVSLVFLNQTQPWIQSGSFMLILSGISAAYIWHLQYLGWLESP